MKICVDRDMANRKYVTTIATSDFSENDKKLMVDFGEPEINLGGAFGGLPAYVEGITDLQAGHDWSAGAESISITYDGWTAVLDLNANCTDADEVLAHITTAINTAGIADSIKAGLISDAYITISTVAVGENQTMDISGSGLTTLGISAGTYVGSGASGIDIPDNYAKVLNGSPFVQVFDDRDSVFPGDAQLKAELWSDTITARIKAAILELRQKADTFTGESCETY